MKISFLHIINSHIKTLCDAENNILKGDIFIFYIIPIIIAILCSIFIEKFEKEVFATSISIFAIFSALLLNSQVAIFGISQKQWKNPKNKYEEEKQDKKLAERSELLAELNINISYLIISCCISLTLFFIFYVFNTYNLVEVFISIFLYIHFLLTLLMVIKRSHALFQKEYEISR